MRYFYEHFFIPYRLEWPEWERWLLCNDAEEPYYDVWG